MDEEISIDKNFCVVENKSFCKWSLECERYRMKFEIFINCI